MRAESRPFPEPVLGSPQAEDEAPPGFEQRVKGPDTPPVPTYGRPTQDLREESSEVRKQATRPPAMPGPLHGSGKISLGGDGKTGGEPKDVKHSIIVDWTRTYHVVAKLRASAERVSIRPSIPIGVAASAHHQDRGRCSSGPLASRSHRTAYTPLRTLIRK